jgi:hypothetical protein
LLLTAAPGELSIEMQIFHSITLHSQIDFFNDSFEKKAMHVSAHTHQAKKSGN